MQGSEWLGEPEEGYAVSLSGFGRVAMALEGLVTDQTLRYIQGHSYSAASTGDPIAEEVTSASGVRIQGGLCSVPIANSCGFKGQSVA